MTDTIFAKPNEPLPLDKIEAMAANLDKVASSPRRLSQWRRHRILRSQHKDLISDRCTIHFSQEDMVRQLQKFVSSTLNPAADIVNNICVVWRGGGVARSVHGVSEAQNTGFEKLVLETGLDAFADDWNADAYFEGPVQVVPWMRGGKIRLESIPAHLYEPAFDAEDPMGDPVAIAVQLRGSDAPPELQEGQDPTPDLCVIDAFSRRYLTKQLGGWTVIDKMTTEHGLGYYPGSTLRFEPPAFGDWWCSDRHSRLVDGTLDVGRIGTTMHFIRRTQNKHFLVMHGPADAFAKGQNVADEKPMVARTPDGASATISSLPYDTDPTNFIREIRFIIESMSESTGVPVSTSVVSGNEIKADYEFDHHALTEKRNQQIWHARNFERDLWPKVVAVARKFDHELSSKLPSEEQMKEMEATFEPLSRRFSDPMVEAKYEDWRMTKGTTSVIKLLRKDHPTLTYAQLKELHEANMKENGEFFEEVAKHNGQPDVRNANAETAAQANGRQGPQVRDANKDQEQ